MEPEIDITPAMIEAGKEALAGFDPREDDPAICVEDAYRAMEAARRS